LCGGAWSRGGGPRNRCRRPAPLQESFLAHRWRNTPLSAWSATPAAAATPAAGVTALPRALCGWRERAWKIVLLQAPVWARLRARADPACRPARRCGLVNLPFTPARLHWARKVERIHE